MHGFLTRSAWPGRPGRAGHRRGHAAPDPTDEESEQLAARGIGVVDGEVVALTIVDDRLTGVRLAGGREFGCDALALLPRMVGQAGLATELGLAAVEHPLGMGAHVAADPSGSTGAPGVWVAGNVATLTTGVIGAAAEGATAAAAVTADLVAEDARLAVERRHSPFTAAGAAATTVRVLGDRRPGMTAATA